MSIDFRLIAFGLVVVGGTLMSTIATSMFEPAAGSEPQPVITPPATTVASATATSAIRPQPAIPTAAPQTTVPDLPRKHPPVAPGSAALPPAQGKAGAPKAAASGFTHFRVGERNVKRILVDGDQVWVGTSGGVVRYNARTDDFRLYDQRTGLKADSIAHVGKLQGRIAVGTLGGGLALLDGQTDQWESFGPAEGLPDGVVNDALQASNGDVWIATRSGVAQVRGGKLRERGNWSQHVQDRSRPGLPSNRVYALAEGRNGDVWAATEAGVALYRNGTWRHVALATGSASEGAGAHGNKSASHPAFVVAIAVDKSGLVWAGTLGGGLLRFDGSSWKRYTLADGLPGDHVLTLHHDAANLLWVGTNSGLARMKDGKFTVMTKQEGLYANAVFAMASAPTALWVGSYGGVARIRTNE